MTSIAQGSTQKGFYTSIDNKDADVDLHLSRMALRAIYRGPALLALTQQPSIHTLLHQLAFAQVLLANTALFVV